MFSFLRLSACDVAASKIFIVPVPLPTYTADSKLALFAYFPWSLIFCLHAF